MIKAFVLPIDKNTISTNSIDLRVIYMNTVSKTMIDNELHSFTLATDLSTFTLDEFNAACEAKILAYSTANSYGVTSADIVWCNLNAFSEADSIALKALAAKRRETYSGTTNASGIYTVTFATAFSAAPNIQANIVGGSDSQIIRLTSVSTTGFTITVRNRTDVVGLLPSYSNVNGAAVDVVITEK